MSKQKSTDFDDSFFKLAETVTKAIQRNKDGTDQKQQVEELMAAEKDFKAAILNFKQSSQIYKKFLQKVCVQNKNILSARPYFRESAVTFSQKITPAIKSNDIESLKTFDINYQLIAFIRENWLGPFPKKAEALFQRVHKARTILIENNMPLAINRAKIFFRTVPRSHLTLMDMVEICGMGLASGIDKYTGEYSPVFRSVCIGRMVGNLIDAYSETSMHFYPSDKRILYKANSIRGRQGITDIEELTNAVNKSFAEDEAEGRSVPKKNISVSELSALMNAASTVSADATTNEEGFGIYHFTPDTIESVEERMIEQETVNEVFAAARSLPNIYRKVLILKGIKL